MIKLITKKYSEIIFIVLMVIIALISIPTLYVLIKPNKSNNLQPSINENEIKKEKELENEEREQDKDSNELDNEDINSKEDINGNGNNDNNNNNDNNSGNSNNNGTGKPPIEPTPPTEIKPPVEPTPPVKPVDPMIKWWKMANKYNPVFRIDFETRNECENKGEYLINQTGKYYGYGCSSFAHSNIIKWMLVPYNENGEDWTTTWKNY